MGKMLLKIWKIKPLKTLEKVGPLFYGIGIMCGFVWSRVLLDFMNNKISPYSAVHDKILIVQNDVPSAIEGF